MQQRSYPRRRRRKAVKYILAAALFIYIVMSVYMAAQQQSPGQPAAAPVPVPAAAAPVQREWNMVLVNKWNPVAGGGDIKLTTLSNGQRVDSRMYPQLQRMFDDMRSQGVYPVVVSGYRTAQEQMEIYNEKIAWYQNQGYSYEDAKRAAEEWVALPGTSEHQLGLAVDVNADGVHSYGVDVYDWLAANAHSYGFIYRYPPEKTGITGVSNEPWHYRYVGIPAAEEIYSRGVCLEEYLGAMQ